MKRGWRIKEKIVTREWRSPAWKESLWRFMERVYRCERELAALENEAYMVRSTSSMLEAMDFLFFAMIVPLPNWIEEVVSGFYARRRKRAFRFSSVSTNTKIITFHRLVIKACPLLWTTLVKISNFNQFNLILYTMLFIQCFFFVLPFQETIFSFF